MRLWGWEWNRAGRAKGRDRPAAARGRPAWHRNWSQSLTAHGPAIPLERELALYDEMRRTFPVLDAAISKLVRLTGTVEVTASAAVREEIEGWLARVHVNQAQRGAASWLGTHLDQMLLYGKAIGEIVPNTRGTEIYALTNLDAKGIELRPGATALELRILQRQNGPSFLVELEPAWTLYSVHHPRGDDPHGTSLLRSLPFVAEVTSVIENATAQVWERMGAPSFHVNWQPEAEFSDPDGSLAARFVDEIAQAFEGAMAARRQGQLQDFFSSGKVSVSVIGSEGQLLAIQEPFRAFAEQMVAATGLPAWMLGLHWSATERLSTQQADMILAHVEALRRSVTPQIERLIELRQLLAGRSGRFRVGWSAINLRDLTEHARAEAWQQQARQRRIENGRRMWELGYWTQEQAARDADAALTHVARAYDAPPGKVERQQTGLSPE